MKSVALNLLLKLDLFLATIYLASYFAGVGWLERIATLVSVPAPLLWTLLLFAVAAFSSWLRASVTGIPSEEKRSTLFFELIVLGAVVVMGVKLAIDPFARLPSAETGLLAYSLSVVVLFGAGITVGHLLFRIQTLIKNVRK